VFQLLRLHERASRRGGSRLDRFYTTASAVVFTGRAWVGAVGDETHTELTAVGDVVNTTARLAAAAGSGEVLVSVEAAAAAGLDPTLEHRRLDLKGKGAPTEVVALTMAA
jgi:adenylate cyclase